MPTPDAADRRMPAWLPRAFVLAAATVLLFVVGLWVLLRLKGLLLLLLISLFLALAIEPPVNRLAAYGWRRGLATGLMFVLLAAVLGLFGAAVGSLLAGQIGNLVHGLPGYVDHLVAWLNRTFHTRLSEADIARQLTRLGGVISGHLSQLATNVWGVGATAIGALFQLFAVLLFTFYLSADGPRIRRAACSLLPPNRQREVLRAWEIAVDKTGGYIYSRALLALASAIAHGIAFWALGVPYAFALALWVGAVSQFIPTVGTYLAGVLPVLVALARSPVTALWVLVLIVVYQQFENLVLHPRVTAHTMRMHPAVAFGAIIAGAAVLGPIGALLAIPAGASLGAFASAYVRRYEVEEHPLTTEQPKPSKPPKPTDPDEPDEPSEPDEPTEPPKPTRPRRGLARWWRR
jgi:predicted PurR-regulated permease PerM